MRLNTTARLPVLDIHSDFTYFFYFKQNRALQDELENGPKAQLARLQQENSILRDALNQATSQTESK